MPSEPRVVLELDRGAVTRLLGLPHGVSLADEYIFVRPGGTTGVRNATLRVVVAGPGLDTEHADCNPVHVLVDADGVTPGGLKCLPTRRVPDDTPINVAMTMGDARKLREALVIVHGVTERGDPRFVRPTEILNDVLGLVRAACEPPSVARAADLPMCAKCFVKVAGAGMGDLCGDCY